MHASYHSKEAARAFPIKSRRRAGELAGGCGHRGAQGAYQAHHQPRRRNREGGGPVPGLGTPFLIAAAGSEPRQFLSLVRTAATIDVI